MSHRKNGLTSFIWGGYVFQGLGMCANGYASEPEVAVSLVSRFPLSKTNAMWTQDRQALHRWTKPKPAHEHPVFWWGGGKKPEFSRSEGSGTAGSTLFSFQKRQSAKAAPRTYRFLARKIAQNPIWRRPHLQSATPQLPVLYVYVYIYINIYIYIQGVVLD